MKVGATGEPASPLAGPSKKAKLAGSSVLPAIMQSREEEDGPLARARKANRARTSTSKPSALVPPMEQGKGSLIDVRG